METMRERIKDCCLEKEQAFCASACPFHIDIPEFVRRIEAGRFTSAYRMYSNAVGFPAIVSALCHEPCQAVCPRKEIDGAISLRRLEHASVEFSPSAKPNRYSLPAKKERVAVVGAGISGLAAALRLTNKKYAVTLYEKNDRIGGALWDLLTPDVFMPELERQFMHESYTLLCDTQVNDLSTLMTDYDAIYVATGSGGNHFGLTAQTDGGYPCATDLPGVFLGGGLVGADAMEALAQGLKAANTIEGYLKTGLMKSAPYHINTKMILDRGEIAPQEPVLPQNGVRYTENEAAAEAGRCLKCQCDACKRHCFLLEYYGKFPQKIEEEVHATLNPGSLDGNATIVTRFISTCNQCGLCGEVCPSEIDVGLFLREGHRAMREKNAMPRAFHEFWLQDMEHANSERASLALLPEGMIRTDDIFFPGCQLGASDPHYVSESYKFLLRENPATGLWLACCGAPALWAGDRQQYDAYIAGIKKEWARFGKPRMILTCPSCAQFFKESLPEMKCVLLYELFDEDQAHTPAFDACRSVAVFDPCSARHNKNVQEKIRKIILGAGCEISKLPYEGRRAQCCSWGGQISIAAPTYTKRLVEKRSEESEAPYIVYCSNCRDVFADAGKPVKHILDVVFRLSDWNRKSPTASCRRRNREKLKNEMINEFWPNEWKEGEVEKLGAERATLLISEALQLKISKAHIIEEDILAVIEHSEREAQVIVDEKNMRRYACGMVGNLTHWAEYSFTSAPNAYELHNAYSHRMKIEI